MTIHVEHRDRVRVLTLDDPDRRNALSAPMVDEIVAERRKEGNISLDEMRRRLRSRGVI